MNCRSVLMQSFPVTLLLPASLAAAGQQVAIQKGMSSAGQPACTIQVGAFADKNNADAIIRRLKQNSFEAFSVRNGKGLYVVLSGAYPTREKARADAARLVTDNLIKEYIIVPFKGGASNKDCRRFQAERGGQAPPMRLPDTRKGPDGGTTSAASTIHTSHVATTLVERAPEAVTVQAPENDSGHMQAHAVVSQGTGSGTTQATYRPEESIEQREHGGRVYPAFENNPGPVQASDSARAATQVQAPVADRARLATAWQQYNGGKIAAAAALFGSLLSQPEFSLEARYGLTRCHLAGKDFARALPELELLVKKRYRLHDTLPELVKILVERREFKKASDYALLFGEKERAVWQGRIEQGIFAQEYARMRERGVPEAVAFVKGHEGTLRRCGQQGAFNTLAAYLAQKGRPDEAAAIYRTMFACSGDEGVQLGILYALKPLVPRAELLTLAEQKQGGGAVTPAHRAKLETFRVEVLRGLLAEEPEHVEKNALALLKMRPDDQVALTTLGWWYFKKERYEEAYGCFRQLSSGASKRPEHVEGMVYALMKLERLDEALTVARMNGNDQKAAALVDEIQLKMLWNKLVILPPDSPEIEVLARRILRIRPDNEDIRVVRAWWYYNREEFAKAYQEFNALYCRNRLGKGYAYGLASTLLKLKRYDEAAAVAADNKGQDERLEAFETRVYLERAHAAYEGGRYEEAERYFAKVVAADPDDEESKTLLESSRYRKTFIAKALSPIVGLSGHTFGSVSRDVHGPFGNGVYGLIQQGIDWVRLPGDTLLRTYGESSYMTRSWEPQYYDLLTNSAGIELTEKHFRVGVEYSVQRWTRQSPSTGTTRGVFPFFGWYHDWSKYMHDESDDAGWFNILSLSGSTYGKVAQDLSGSTGTTAMGMVNQGIDWLALPGNIILNSFGEFRFNLRTRDYVYYNSYGPAVGTELQKSPFRAGVEYYWEHDPGQHLIIPRVTLYLRWYYDWDLKPKK